MKLTRENITEELLKKNEYEKPKSMEELFEIIEKDFCPYYSVYGQDTKIEFLKSITNLDYFFKKVRDEEISKIYKEKAIIMITDIYIKFGILFYEKIKGKNEYCFEDLIFSNEEEKSFEIYYKKYFFSEKMEEFVLKDIILVLADMSSKNFKKEELIKYFKINYNLLNWLKFFFKITDEEIFQEFLIRHIIKMSEKGIGFQKRIKRKHKILKYSNLNLEVKKLFKSQIENLFFTKQKLDKKYPNFREWLDKVYKEVEEDNTKREIFIFLNYYDLLLKIEGISILKKTKDEKKISYLYISDYQDVFEIFERINKFLGTETPLFSIEKELFKGKYEYYLSSENAIEILKKIDKKLKFNLTSVVPNKYVVGKTELIFNEVGKKKIDIDSIKKNKNENTTTIFEKFYDVKDNEEKKMLKREEISEELMEKYKEKRPKNITEILRGTYKNNNYFFYNFYDYDYNFKELIKKEYEFINKLMFFYYSYGKILKSEVIKMSTVLSISDFDRNNLIKSLTDILISYGSFKSIVLKILSQKLKYTKIEDDFLKEFEILLKIPFISLSDKRIKLLLFDKNEENNQYETDIKKVILNTIERTNKNNNLLGINEKENEIGNNIIINFDIINSISEDLFEIFKNILKLMFLFQITLIDVSDEIFIREILKRENLGKIKRHKILKYSQVDLNTRENLREFFTNKTSKQYIKNLYPNFDEWFNKVLKEIEEDNTKREILFFGNIDSNGLQIEGITILKNTEEEKKICYLYTSFSEDVENIFEEIYNYLGTETPLITVEKEIFEIKYRYILKPLNEEVRKKRKLKFNLTSIVPDKYIEGKTELIFNEVGKDGIDIEYKNIDKILDEMNTKIESKEN